MLLFGPMCLRGIRARIYMYPPSPSPHNHNQGGTFTNILRPHRKSLLQSTIAVAKYEAAMRQNYLYLSYMIFLQEEHILCHEMICLIGPSGVRAPASQRCGY